MENKLDFSKPNKCVNCGYALPHIKGSYFCSAYCQKDFQDKNNRKK